jgi:hypothetical protein
MSSKQLLTAAIAAVLCAPVHSAPPRPGPMHAAPLPGDSPPMQQRPYAIVDTAQNRCYDDSVEIDCPESGDLWFGQDAQHQGNQPSYRVSRDGLTVQDLVTGLTWQQSPDTNGDGVFGVDDKLSYTELQAYVDALNAEQFGGYSDWRVPSIKELYSLMDFRGVDPSVDGLDTTGLTPFIDSGVFDFAYGFTDVGERVIDSQYASSTVYLANDNMLFGVNFADGRIKGYGMGSGLLEAGDTNMPMPGEGDLIDTPPALAAEKNFTVQLVRGNPYYGRNAFRDNGDDTVSDLATGLTWMQQDSAEGMVWSDALDYCANADDGGFDDWRLPDAKELQSIVDYDRSPDTTASAAIAPVFGSTTIVNEDGVDDFPYYWTGTTHAGSDGFGYSAVYLAFGRSLGETDGILDDVHGAGSQRSDPKSGSADDFPQSYGPQGDIRRLFNYVRCVRDGVAPATAPGADHEGIRAAGVDSIERRGR